MLKISTLLLLILLLNSVTAQVTLTHNIENTPIKTNIPSCEVKESWARTFTLSDFGISTADQFIIYSGQVAISNSYDGARLVFNFYSVNSEEPGYKPQRISYGNLVYAPKIGDTPQVVQIDFGTPITIPAGVEKILVEVTQMDDVYNDDYKKVRIAGTEFGNNTSWYKGCMGNYTHIPIENLGIPIPNVNFYINVTGKIQNIASSGSSVTMSHNVCDDIIETRIHSCTSSYIYWARDFYLADFGISSNEEFVITSGQVGINKVGWLPEISFNIYAIDSNFPDSFSETNLIGSSQYQELQPNINRNSRIVNVDFDTPIVVPAGVERILVEVHKGIVYGDGLAFIAGSAQDTGISWQRGCTRTSSEHDFDYNEYVNTADFGRPDVNFYINVTGNVKHLTNSFSMNISNVCSDFLKEFGVVPAGNIASVLWNFGDATSGADNTSTDESPFHDFSADGTYTITATITANDGSTEVLIETINAKEPPHAYGISNIYACEESFGTGISSEFDLAQVTQQVLGGQNNMRVTFIDGSGNEYTTLPNPFTNTKRDKETIMVRVAHNNNLCCYSETTFDLIVNPIPELSFVSDLFVCSNNSNGFASFDLEQLQNDILSGSNASSVSFYRENGNKLQAPLSAVENMVLNEEKITVRAFESVNNCYNETTFKLIVNPMPIANSLPILIGCDDNGDGISEYFDTSNIESEVLGNQKNIAVSYFDANGNILPSPLPSPYTNIVPNEETITVRLTNTQTHCYDDTSIVLKTSSKPQINRPQPVYACDLGSGFASFDLSHIEKAIIGEQVGLIVTYFNTDGVEFSNPQPTFYENTVSWNQTIYVRVENSLNHLCYAETSFDLLVSELPTTILEPIYYLCHLEPLLHIKVENDYEFYSWVGEDSSVISNTYEVNLIDGGNYTLTLGKNFNGVYCENTFDFEFKRSLPPIISEVRHSRLSENNFIEIIAFGDGDFEYSLDGINFQDSNFFPDILGGNYTSFVRDKNGCGEDSEDVLLVDYPRFFTPNNDNRNDYWHITGIENFHNSKTYIFDRYGKFLIELSSKSRGWDGFFSGAEMISDDYWFKTNLGEGRSFSGHFVLKR